MGQRDLTDPLARAAIAGDASAFDALVDERRVWRRLEDGLGPEREELAARMPRRGGLIDVGEALATGQPGLWLATAWLFEVTPTARAALFPAHERWDVLVEQHRVAPEAPWLCAELAASLTPSQAGLFRRIERGYTRRFDDQRGAWVWAARVG